ncbi:hypothetical protein LXM94_19925 [Rhizobium sp. TRM95111]|uniref:hypothetical protein n=1 Tax=Rhizobium alarense TaxID=2846851 RepID=UPI001F2374BC|nr:hypothetical protein [Rhizobium alarense]MCF3642242.1 hypothetical protein [Rhizobium alarense]
MARFRMPLSGDVVQSINPWTWIFSPSNSQISLFHIDLGPSGDPDVEAEVLSDVASYGRQIGRMQDVLLVLVDRLEKAGGLSEREEVAIGDFKALTREIDGIKRRHERKPAAA